MSNETCRSMRTHNDILNSGQGSLLTVKYADGALNFSEHALPYRRYFILKVMIIRLIMVNKKC